MKTRKNLESIETKPKDITQEVFNRLVRDHNVKNIDLNKIVLKRKQELSHSLQAATQKETINPGPFSPKPQFPPIKNVEEFFKIESKHFPDDGTSCQSTPSSHNPNPEKYNNVEKYKHQAKLFNKIKSLVNQQSPKMTINNITKNQLKHKLKDSHCYVDE